MLIRAIDHCLKLIDLCLNVAAVDLVNDLSPFYPFLSLPNSIELTVASNNAALSWITIISVDLVYLFG
jgi:hypothetical protein